VCIVIRQTNSSLNIADPATNASGSGWFPIDILLVFVFDLFDMAGRALPNCNFTRWVPLLSTRALFEFIGTIDC
jgi:hypothetical protein